VHNLRTSATKHDTQMSHADDVQMSQTKQPSIINADQQPHRLPRSREGKFTRPRCIKTLYQFIQPGIERVHACTR